MKNKIPSIIMAISIVAAIAGISIGVKASQEKRAAQQEAAELRDQLNAQKAKKAKAASSLVGLKNMAATGTNDVAKLQEQLAARDAELARLRAALETRRNENNENRRQSFQDRMAQLKEEDPERYEQMVQERTERHNEMRYNQATRLADLMDMDTSGMNAEQLANHDALLEKLTALWDATGEEDPENRTDRETMRELMTGINEMMETERNYMFEQLGGEVGLSSSESAEFSAYVESIIDATTIQRPGRGGGGGGGGR